MSDALVGLLIFLGIYHTNKSQGQVREGERDYKDKDKGTEESVQAV